MIHIHQRLSNTVPATLLAVALGAGAALVAAGDMAWAQLPPPPEVTPGSLKDAPIPTPRQLARYVRDRQAAIALGKALFWDMQVGSDGQACASCHFQAGADNRSKHTLNPGLRLPPNINGNGVFDPTRSGARGPNYTLRRGDFPFM
ncbi:MAG: cytochrome c peroxidase [Gammaproteobacteria bacterium]